MNKVFINNYCSLKLAEDFKWKDIAERPNERFGRYDLLTKAALAAVEQLGLPLDQPKDADTALLLATGYGCLAVDYHFFQDKQDNPPSPTLFTYTLPSVALGEIAIRYRLTGANLTILDNDPYGKQALLEGVKELWRGECRRLIFIMADGLSSAVAPLVRENSGARALALELTADKNEKSQGQIIIEKFTAPVDDLLPQAILLDYLDSDHQKPWQVAGKSGKNYYKLTLSFNDK